MKESIRTRVKIKEPWQPEFTGHFETIDGELLKFTIVNVDTGEIRQKTVTLDFIARHLFKNIKTEKIERIEKDCDNCKHVKIRPSNDPCRKCVLLKNNVFVSNGRLSDNWEKSNE